MEWEVWRVLEKPQCCHTCFFTCVLGVDVTDTTGLPRTQLGTRTMYFYAFKAAHLVTKLVPCSTLV